VRRFRRLAWELPGPIEKVEEVKQHFAVSVKHYAAATFSGGLPPGALLDFYRQMITSAREADVPAIVDSSGEALRLGIQSQRVLVQTTLPKL
jgi:fructose-1-phosphate kinase PfkB-like protein